MAEKESTVGSIIGTIVLAAVCVAGGWIGKDMWPKGDGGAAAAQAAKLAAMAAMQQTVAVTNAELRVYNLPERFVAHAEAVQEVDLLPQIDGYVREIKFKEGDVVKEGQVLYVIDDERYQAVANQRKADLAAAEAEARRAERYFERMQKADERGITQLERDNAEAAAEKAKAAVLQAKANLVVAEYDLKKTTVFAPISGQIGKSSAHVGDTSATTSRRRRARSRKSCRSTRSASRSRSPTAPTSRGARRSARARTMRSACVSSFPTAASTIARARGTSTTTRCRAKRRLS